MNEHHLTFSLIPPGHPGARYAPGRGDNDTADPIGRAMAEGELLRARILEIQRDGLCDCPPLSDAA
jgi:hypothetical protein